MIELQLRNKLFLFLFIVPFLLTAQEKSLVIVHFNDLHSQIEPQASNDARNAKKEGVTREDTYIREVRKETKNVVVFHNGNMVQGSPYFTMFTGDVEIDAANRMKLDAATLGNHEFDNGLDFLAKMIRRAHFPFVTTNLDFTGTPLDGLTEKYHIFNRNGLKIGVIGLLLNLDGLVEKKNYAGMKYLDPLESATKTATYLKKVKKCDVVICLSHLGYYPDEEKIGDITLAKSSRNIDVILGGHTHTALQHPDRRVNLDGEDVIIHQTGAYGINMGRLNIVVGKKK